MASKSLSRLGNKKLETISHYSTGLRRAKTISAQCWCTALYFDSLQMKPDER